MQRDHIYVIVTLPQCYVIVMENILLQNIYEIMIGSIVANIINLTTRAAFELWYGDFEECMLFNRQRFKRNFNFRIFMLYE